MIEHSKEPPEDEPDIEIDFDDRLEFGELAEEYTEGVFDRNMNHSEIEYQASLYYWALFNPQAAYALLSKPQQQAVDERTKDAKLRYEAEMRISYEGEDE